MPVGQAMVHAQLSSTRPRHPGPDGVLPRHHADVIPGRAGRDLGLELRSRPRLGSPRRKGREHQPDGVGPVRPPQFVRCTRIDNIIEFGRAVHAEMAALTDAAVRGVSVTGCTVYSTTFPCHLCTRHIIAAGIKRVVYIHPYPKSLAAQLHQDSIAIDVAHPARNLVRFEPFVGLAPRRFLNLFTASVRKVPGGRASKFNPAKAVPKLVPSEAPGVAPVYPARELAELRAFNTLVRERGYKTRNPRRRSTGSSTTRREQR
jgi:deoxycytidylate deaminase